MDFALAHCNFTLRGDESDADEDFVVQLGESLDVEVFSQRFDTESYAKENKLSIQMAARELRYDWFYDLANELDFDYGELETGNNVLVNYDKQKQFMTNGFDLLCFLKA